MDEKLCPHCSNPIGAGDSACMMCGGKLAPTCQACGSERVTIERRLTSLGRKTLVLGIALLPLFGIGLAVILIAYTLAQRSVRCAACGEEYTIEGAE